MNPYIQVFLAVVIVIILFVGALLVYNQETVKAIRQTGQIKKSVPIFSGIVDFFEKNNLVYDTLNPNAPNYINMGNSINQVSGAEYSYNFWLYVDNTNKKLFGTTNDGTNTTQIFADQGLTASSNPNLLPFVLFLRGSNKVLEYKNQCSAPKTTVADSTNYKTDVLVKSPLVKLEHGGDVLTVEFNTLDSPDVVQDGARNTCVEIDTNWSFINQYKIGLKNMTDPQFSKQWFMVTIVLQDTLPSDPYPLRNKIRSRIFINGALKLDKYVVGQLGNNASNKPIRMNQGNLYVNPSLTLQDGSTNVSMTHVNNSGFLNKQIMMADLTYYNYALSSEEISGLFASQFNKTYAPQLSTTIPDTSYLNVTTNTNPQANQIYK